MEDKKSFDFLRELPEIVSANINKVKKIDAALNKKKDAVTKYQEKFSTASLDGKVDVIEEFKQKNMKLAIEIKNMVTKWTEILDGDLETLSTEKDAHSSDNRKTSETPASDENAYEPFSNASQAMRPRPFCVCTCGEISTEPEVRCGYLYCPVGKYHLSCTNLQEIPLDTWYCPACRYSDDDESKRDTVTATT